MRNSKLVSRCSSLSLAFALVLSVGCGGLPLDDEAGFEAEEISTYAEALATGVSLVVKSRSRPRSAAVPVPRDRHAQGGGLLRL